MHITCLFGLQKNVLHLEDQLYLGAKSWLSICEPPPAIKLLRGKLFSNLMLYHSLHTDLEFTIPYEKNGYF